MMSRKIKFGKIAVVIFLTVLIWVWMDLALQVEYPVSNVPLTIAKSTSRALWINFVDVVDENETLVPVYTIKSIDFKGSASRISEVRRKLRTGSLQLDFFLDAEQEGMDKPDKYPLDVLNLLRKSDQIQELGLTVQSCEPDKLTVNVVELVEKSLDIECVDESGTRLDDVKSIDPAEVVMFVPADIRKAQVKLTRTDIVQARLSGVVKTPIVVLAPGQIRHAPAPVKIKMPPEADSLSEYLIEEAKLGFTLSANFQGKYKVDVNYNEVVRPFTILATEEAKLAYESQPFQMTLYILDSDAQKGPKEEQREQRRKVVYNLPKEFVRRDEIKLKNPQQSAEAKFKLIPLSSAETPSGGVD